MSSLRHVGILAGSLFLLTHVTSVGARIVMGPVLADPTAPDGTTALLVGSVLEVILAVAVLGTSIALFPIARRVSETIAAGYIALRTLEASVILTGVATTLALASVRLTGDASLDPIARTLATLQDWTFVVGPGLVCGVNTVLMAWLVYRSGFVPRFIGVLGLIGGPLVFAANLVKVFGQSEALMPWIGVTVVPIFAWEICLAVYLIVRGPRSTATVARTPEATSTSNTR